MLFVIHALDYAHALPRRLSVYAEHRAYLAGPLPVKLVISGPLVAEDNETMIGSLFLVEADSRHDVLAFHQNDPFYAAGVWEQVSINQFLKRQDNRS